MPHGVCSGARFAVRRECGQGITVQRQHGIFNLARTATTLSGSNYLELGTHVRVGRIVRWPKE